MPRRAPSTAPVLAPRPATRRPRATPSTCHTQVEELAIRTLAGVAADGFEPEAVEASLNTVEFDLREMNTGGFPKGLAFMLALLPRCAAVSRK